MPFSVLPHNLDRGKAEEYRQELFMSLQLHSAAGSNAGFVYQFERALYWLAKSPAASVIGIETDDDVTVRGPNSATVLEQDKHSIQKDSTPFGDRSKDLWNTLSIWVEALTAKEVEPDRVRFLMVTNKQLPDCLAKRIGRARTSPEIETCILALQSAGENPPSQIRDQIRRVLAPESREALRDVIKNCDLADASQATEGFLLRQATIDHLQLPDWCLPASKSITNELLGWLHTSALTEWQQQKPAWIHRNHFVNQLHAIISLRRRQATRERAEHLIPVPEEKVGREKGSRFVKQLHLITDDDSVVDTAIREFIRCNIEKTRLSVEGNITDDDWKTFEVTLLSRWEKIRARVIRTKSTASEEDVGFEIFTDVTESHCEKLAGADTEQVYLTSGTYHRLADMIRVGWHPRYLTLMQEIISEL